MRMGSKKKQILIAEDHPLFRAMLVQLVERELGMAVCGQADNVKDALTLVERTQPDAAIIDLTLDGARGFDLIKEISARHASLPVLALSMDTDRLYAERVFRAGAKGFISKQEPPAEVIAAIRAVIAGQTYSRG